MNYLGRIMNIPAEQTQGMCDYEQTIYKLGHRDARHAAAEIANEADALVAELLEALESALELMTCTEMQSVKIRGKAADIKKARATIDKARRKV